MIPDKKYWTHLKSFFLTSLRDYKQLFEISCLSERQLIGIIDENAVLSFYRFVLQSHSNVHILSELGKLCYFQVCGHTYMYRYTVSTHSNTLVVKTQFFSGL